MAMNDYYLIAGLCLLCLEFIYFLNQRKLMDKRTKYLLVMMLTSMGICALGIIITFLLINVPSKIIVFFVSLLYAFELCLPYCLHAMTRKILRKNDFKSKKLNDFVFLFGIMNVILNPFIGHISYFQDNLLFVGTCYKYLIWGIVGWYLIDFIYILWHYKSLEKRCFNSLMEVSLLLIGSMLIQNVCKIQLFVGFGAALAVTILYLVLNSPLAYIDLSTHVFNGDYFNYWIWEQIHLKKETHLLVIKINQLKYMHDVHQLGNKSELLDYITKQLWNISYKHLLFRIQFDQFVLCCSTKKQQEKIINQLNQIFPKGYCEIPHGDFTYISMYQINHIEKLENENNVLSYIEFLLNQQTNNQQFIQDTEKLYLKYLNEQEIERYLLKAIDQDLFDVWYQPIYSIHEHKFVALEALSRLQHPQLGWISPEVFIGIAEKEDLIFKMMPLQIKRICKFINENQKDLKDIDNIKVNLSPLEFAKPGYCEYLIDIIKSYSIPLDKFQFEITESTATTYTKELEEVIYYLKQNGIRICLDDFGSGYANLNSILHLPFSVIKMDRSLLKNICEDESVSMFYQNMVRTLKNMGYKIVAEGIEERKEVELMEQWHVDMIQGYYYSKPLNSKEVIEKIKEKK